MICSRHLVLPGIKVPPTLLPLALFLSVAVPAYPALAQGVPKAGSQKPAPEKGMTQEALAAHFWYSREGIHIDNCPLPKDGRTYDKFYRNHLIAWIRTRCDQRGDAVVRAFRTRHPGVKAKTEGPLRGSDDVSVTTDGHEIFTTSQSRIWHEQNESLKALALVITRKEGSATGSVLLKIHMYGTPENGQLPPAEELSALTQAHMRWAFKGLKLEAAF